MAATISAVINTLNAERYLDLSLESVSSWVDEIVIADMASSDRTVDIARRFGATVIEVPPAGYVEPAREEAVAAARGDWVLVLDADELVEPALAAELRDIAETGRADVVWLRRVNYILGVAVDHSAWEGDSQLRFHRRGSVAYSAWIHSQPSPQRGARVIRAVKGSLLHFAYTGIDDLISRMDRYTTVEAQARWRAGSRPSMWRALYGAVREVGGRYFVHRGFRHGWRGLTLALLMASYRVVIEAKLIQLHSIGDARAVTDAYRRTGREILDRGPRPRVTKDRWPRAR